MRLVLAFAALLSGCSLAPRPWTLRVENRCPRAVRVVMGAEPSPGAAALQTLEPDQGFAKSGLGADTLWLVDDSGAAVSSWEIDGGDEHVSVLPSCRDLGPG